MNNLEIKKNSVIEIIIPSKRGRGVERPAVVLSIVGNIISVVVCTAHPNPKERTVEIPSSQNGKAVTKLRQRTWAIISWRGEISYDNVTEIPGGFIKGNDLEKIINAIKSSEENSENYSLDFVEWLKIRNKL